MRIFRGLENIQSVIDRHEAEWRRDNGEEPEYRSPRYRASLEENVRRRLTAQPDEGSGRFAADRFLSGKSEPVKLKKPPMPEPEPATEPDPINVESESSPADTARHSWLYNEVMKAVNEASAGRKDTKIVAVFVPVIQSEGEARDIPARDDEAHDEGENVRAVEIIRNKDGRHSRLYDEVMRAVNDAADDSRRIVAVFVPLLQDGKEFENLPADETVTISPVSEDDVRIETLPEAEADPVNAAAALVEAVPVTVAVIPEALEPEPEPEPEPEQISVEDFDLIPEGQVEADTELAEAFREMEDKLDEAIDAPEQDEEAALEPIPELILEPEITEDEQPEFVPDDEDNEDDILADGEPMEFEDIETVRQDDELALPDELDDDDIDDDEGFDESILVVHRPDDDEEAIIIDGDDEIEIIPDPS